MMKSGIQFILTLMLIATQHVNAFELATHGLLTFNAYTGSVLASDDFIGSLGLQNETKPFGGTIGVREQLPLILAAIVL